MDAVRHDGVAKIIIITTLQSTSFPIPKSASIAPLQLRDYPNAGTYTPHGPPNISGKHPWILDGQFIPIAYHHHRSRYRGTIRVMAGPVGTCRLVPGELPMNHGKAVDGAEARSG
jgi:hypothetical protein